MDKNFVNILQQMVAKETKEAILNPAKCKAFIKDYARGEYKKEIKWLLLALDEKVQIAINDTDDLQNCKQRQVRVLKDECGFSDDIAIAIVDMLAFVLCGDTIKESRNDISAVEYHLTDNYKEAMTKQISYIIRVLNNYISKKTEIVLKEKSIITFGAYQWLVLEVQNDKALLLSKDIIEKRKYHEKAVGITWEKCDLRAYLNGQFFNSNSFTNADRARILQVNNTNENNQWYGTNGGVSTSDKIFLLSISEVVKYFGDSGQLKNKNPKSEYFINDKYNSERIAQYNGSAFFWWLRSSGYHSIRASFVHRNGHIPVVGVHVFIDYGGVRPALWLKL